MSKMICECGHEWNTHDGEGCDYCEWGEHGSFNACLCENSRLLVEARHWARRMKLERDEIKAKAQEQSEEIQLNWIAPYEKVGMQDKINRLTTENKILCQQLRFTRDLIKQLHRILEELSDEQKSGLNIFRGHGFLHAAP